MAEPICPECGEKGMDNILNTAHANFMVIYCDKCGYVYNVLPKK